MSLPLIANPGANPGADAGDLLRLRYAAERERRCRMRLRQIGFAQERLARDEFATGASSASGPRQAQ